MVVTIGVISIKGGVGKTTVSASLATDLANHYHQKVLLVDTNYTAPNLGLHMDIVEPVKTIHEVIGGKAMIRSAIHKRFGVDVIPGSFSHDKNINLLKLKDRLSQIKNEYDFIILDSSPNLNDEMLSTMVASDCLFVVSTPDYPTLSCSLRAAQLARSRGTPISGIIINKIRDPHYELSLEDIEDAIGIPVVAALPDEKMNIRSVFTRIPMPLYKKNSQFAREIGNLSAALTHSEEQKSWLSDLFQWNVKKERINREVLKDGFYKSIFSFESEPKVQTQGINKESTEIKNE